MDYVNYFAKNAFAGNEFIIFFEHCVDKLIAHHVPVEYEYMLDKAKLPVNQGVLKKYPFLEKIVFPKMKKMIRDHKAYLEIEAMQLKMKACEKYGENSGGKQCVYNEKGVIALNEKCYEMIREKVLNLFLVEMLEMNMKTYSYSTSLSDNDTTMSGMGSNNDNQMLNLSSFISYYITNKSEDNNDRKYIFNINFSFDTFISLIHKDNSYLLNQLDFWFNFYLPYLKIPIENLQYDYFFSEINQFNTTDFKWKIQHLFCEYLTFIQYFLKRVTTSNIIITITNNLYWVEEILERVTNDPETLISSLLTLDLNNFTLLTLIAKMNQMLLFNHIILNYFGSCSNIKCNEVLETMIKMNTIQSLLINYFEFNDFEYLHMVKMSEETMKKAIDKTIEQIGGIRAIVKELKERKGKTALTMIAMQIKEFTSYKSYMKEIMVEMDRLVKDIINWKGGNVMISYSDIIENIAAFEAISSYGKGVNKGNGNDLTYSNPSLFIDHSQCLIKMSKCKSGRNSFYLSLFERDLKVMLNKTIDLYYIRSYSHNGLIPVTHLTLGYFPSLNDLITFLMKIPLSAMITLLKAKFFLRSNKGMTNERLKAFFSLNWPRKTLKSIKLIYEKDTNVNAFDVFTFYDQCFLKKYFVVNEPMKPLASHQSVMSSLPKKTFPKNSINVNKNNESSIFNPILQASHSAMVEMSTSMALLHKSSTKTTPASYPIEQILLTQIDTYLQYKLNMKSLYNITIDINNNKSFNKSLEKRKLRDRFTNCLIVSEYNNTKLSLSLLYALMKHDFLNRTSIVFKLKTKLIKHHFQTETSLLQHISRYFKGRRCFFTDFPNSSKIFSKYSNELSKTID